MHRSALWILTLVFLTLPLSAQSLPEPTCGQGSKGAFSSQGVPATGTYQPLPNEQRLYYGLAGLERGALEIRYLVEGAQHLTETVDLSAPELPRIHAGRSKSPLTFEKTLELHDRLNQPRMMELLALRPDLVQQLYRLSQSGSHVELEVFQQGALLEAFSFDELLRRSTELRKGRTVQVVVPSTVQGPGDQGKPIQRQSAVLKYLESCADCTSTTPCDTECGYDPGKGGPVTCGEYGVCQWTCDCETVISDRWTDWYRVREFPGTDFRCFVAFGGGSRWHQAIWTEWRRDRIRRTYVCPNCPSCDNCYTREELIAYELAYTYCWLDTGPSCSPGSWPCCSSLCLVGGLTPCVNC